jgi:hypothetical protein
MLRTSFLHEVQPLHILIFFLPFFLRSFPTAATACYSYLESKTTQRQKCYISDVTIVASDMTTKEKQELKQFVQERSEYIKFCAKAH